MNGVAVETWIDKTEWGDGPWLTEPDRIEWRSHGLACLMLRNPNGGNWCGYVGLPPGHAWHGEDYDNVSADVHGGLTFAGECMSDDRPMRERVCHVQQPGESDDVWWLGFDCHHGFDLAPAFEARMHAFAFPTRPFDIAYRDVEYVRAEVEHLAKQCAERVS